MTTSPTHTLTVTVTTQRDDNPERTTVKIVDVPPDYEIEDLKQFYGVVVEATAGEHLDDADWRRPRFRALLINAARLWRIEQIINALPTSGDKGVVRQQIFTVLTTPDDEALDQWGILPID